MKLELNTADKSNTKVLVTGGAGFIGCALIRKLSEIGAKIHCIDSLTYASSIDRIKPFISVDKASFSHESISNKVAMEEVFNTFKPNAILHLAAESHVDRSIEKSEDFIQTNLVGTSVLLEVYRDYFCRKPEHYARFIHVSTDEVYGSLKSEGEFSEESPYRPNSPYSASKAGSDHLARAWAMTYNLPITITNCSNNFGPHQHDEKLIPTIIRTALSGQVIPIYGTGQNVRDWLYVDDHVDALITILHAKNPAQQYCIGGGAEHSNIALCKKVCRILDKLRPRSDGKSYCSQITFVEDRKGHDFRYAINSSKIYKDLGWKAKRDFNVSIEQTIKWYLGK